MRKRWEYQVSRQVPASPVVVWEAFGDAAKFLQWFALDGHFEARVGTPFEFRHGPSAEEVERGTVVAVEPGYRLAYQSGPAAEPTVMTFHLETEGAGTRITMVQSGFCGADVDLDELLKGSIAGCQFILGNLELFLREGYTYQHYPYLGLRTEPAPEGAVIREVTLPWAMAAGLQVGDVILAIGSDVLGANSPVVRIWEASRQQRANQPVAVRLLRDGLECIVTVTPGGWRETMALRQPGA